MQYLCNGIPSEEEDQFKLNNNITSQKPFFVYGTLLPKQPNFSLWGNAIVQMEPAHIDGYQLYDLGAYPMAISRLGYRVHGMLVTVKSDSYERMIHRLDQLEGYDTQRPEQGMYQRVVQRAWVNGRFQLAHLYLGIPSFVEGATSIPSGDWHTHLSQSDSDLHNWWETIETVAGLHHS